MPSTEDLVRRSQQLVGGGRIAEAAELMRVIEEAPGGLNALLTEADAIGEVEHAWLLVGVAFAHWQLGSSDEALAYAKAGRAMATNSGDGRVRAAAHLTMALAVSLNGDPATVTEHYARAADCAAASGDLPLLARINANRSHHLVADAHFTEATKVAAAAGAAAQECGSWLALCVALQNEAEALLRLGRYDEALDCCERTVALAGRIGTPPTAGALILIAQIHLRRGCREQARAALEQALRLHCDTPDRQVRVPALALLALTLLPDGAEQAFEPAAIALREATGSQLLPALLAAGHVARAHGEANEARDLAARAVAHARARREPSWLAEALELRALTVDGRQGRIALQEARRIWEDAGAVHDLDRVLVRLATTPAVSSSDRVAGRLARARLRAAGLAGMLPTTDGPTSARIVTFGRLEVLVDGSAVGAQAWQSRRARDLLRLLVCRRGRAMPRLEICEALWPDDDPVRTNHRLSVLLSIVRGVIGPDALICDQACVALDRARVEVDVEEFLADVRDAAALMERGGRADAGALLVEALEQYGDEPFADAPYDDMTTALRDEARAAYLQALRLLAHASRRDGAHDRAAGYLRRLLAEDRYDEDAHRTLIGVLNRAGRHGQARSAAGRYRSAMAEIGLRPAG